MSEETLPPRPVEATEPVTERATNRSHRPASAAFRAFVAQGWRPRPDDLPALGPAARPAARRREQIGARFPGETLVLPAGPLVTRSNDTDYRFRPHSAFAYLTGLGADQEPDAVLVLHPRAETDEPTHDAVLYFRPLADRDTEEFYADPRYGELWVGARPSLAELAALTGIRCVHIDLLAGALPAADAEGAPRLRAVPGVDPVVDRMVERARGHREDASATPQEAGATTTGGGAEATAGSDDSTEATAGSDGGAAGRAGSDGGTDRDAALVEALAEMRLVKDAYEIEQMRLAVAATVRGFERIVSDLPRARSHPRGERVVEGAFGALAREEGNGVGYETIAAAGDHACTLHWVRNDGPLVPGSLVLVDAGVEVDSLYTADVTRTLPVDGVFTEPQRRLYDAVLEAADAAFAVVRPGATLRQVHDAAMGVIAARLEEWGWLPVTAQESLTPDGQFHRRWMVHGTSHHLGIDVHDCAQARREAYLDGALRPGAVFTIEPGLYVKSDDLSAPPEFRGIGIRIEDDVLVTAEGAENLSSDLPRTADGVEAWMARLMVGRPRG